MLMRNQFQRSKKKDQIYISSGKEYSTPLSSSSSSWAPQFSKSRSQSNLNSRHVRCVSHSPATRTSDWDSESLDRPLMMMPRSRRRRGWLKNWISFLDGICKLKATQNIDLLRRLLIQSVSQLLCMCPSLGNFMADEWRDSAKSLWSGDSPFMYNMFYYIGFIITTLAVLKSKFHSETGYHLDSVQHTRRDLWFAFHRTRSEIDSSLLTTLRVFIDWVPSSFTVIGSDKIVII